MQCKHLEEVLEQNGFNPLSADAREHLASCSACQDLFADFSAISLAAREIPAEVAPPDRLWVSLQARLESEGLIQPSQSATISMGTSWWENFSSLLRPRTLATAAVGLALVIAAAMQIQKPSTPRVANNPVAKPNAANPSAAAANVPATNKVQEQPAPQAHAAAAATHDRALLPSPTESASTTLSEAELDVPDMQLAGNSTVDASLRQNLRTLNEFIAECEQHLKQNPQDQLAREYLHAAYQQKAELLSAMIESGRSEH